MQNQTLHARALLRHVGFYFCSTSTSVLQIIRPVVKSVKKEMILLFITAEYGRFTKIAFQVFLYTWCHLLHLFCCFSVTFSTFMTSHAQNNLKLLLCFVCISPNKNFCSPLWLHTWRKAITNKSILRSRFHKTVDVFWTVAKMIDLGESPWQRLRRVYKRLENKPAWPFLSFTRPSNWSRPAVAIQPSPSVSSSLAVLVSSGRSKVFFFVFFVLSFLFFFFFQYCDHLLPHWQPSRPSSFFPSAAAQPVNLLGDKLIWV